MKSLSTMICEQLDVEFRSAKFYQILQAVCFYLVGAKGAFELQSELQDMIDFSKLGISAKDFRLYIMSNNKSLINLKFFLLNIIKTTVEKSEVKALARDCGISSHDGTASYIVVYKHRYKLRRVKYIKTLTKEQIAPHNLDTLETLFANIHNKVMATVRQVTYTRLRFCSSSTNTELRDFHADLMFKAVLSFYRLMPTTQPEAYILNYLRRSVSNDAKNTIKKYTSKKGGRLIGTGKDGFGANRSELLVTSENQLNVRQESDEQISYDSMMAWDIQEEQASNFEVEFSIQQVLERYLHLSNKSRALHILFGHEDQEFTQFLRKNKYIPAGKDQTDFQTKASPEKFRQALALFINVDQPQLEGFIEKIKRQFAGDTKLKVV